MGRDKPYEEERKTVDGGDSSQYSQSREKGENARERERRADELPA